MISAFRHETPNPRETRHHAAAEMPKSFLRTLGLSGPGEYLFRCLERVIDTGTGELVRHDQDVDVARRAVAASSSGAVHERCADHGGFRLECGAQWLDEANRLDHQVVEFSEVRGVAFRLIVLLPIGRASSAESSAGTPHGPRGCACRRSRSDE